ncbi:hypothetical protein PCASD_01173 [Puccinia coronata f. sp. avenae]|uniref:Uncharacterized protein n=1 Tax=Puccinia coronata f. sp. avenae TaxID=200324 RepID=A0A2N5VLG7_9BASI|nr:hypothetical protein PCASD_01173 [Puccinia coronata f. sp. avenae]
MAPKRKEGESSKSEKAADPTSAQSGDEETSTKKPKYVKEDPGMTAKQFEESAKGITISLGEEGNIGTLLAEPTTFTTGSFGWKASSKMRVKVTVDGEEKDLLVQVGVNMTVSGSKPDVKRASNGKRGRPRKNPVSTED